VAVQHAVEDGQAHRYRAAGHHSAQDLSAACCIQLDHGDLACLSVVGDCVKPALYWAFAAASSCETSNSRSLMAIWRRSSGNLYLLSANLRSMPFHSSLSFGGRCPVPKAKARRATQEVAAGSSWMTRARPAGPSKGLPLSSPVASMATPFSFVR